MDIKEGFSSKKLVVNVKQEKKLETDECNTSTDCNPKAKISLIGIRRQKNGRYAARITDPFRHKKVWLGTFDTVEEASQAYFSKKSEFENEKLRHRRNKKSKRIRKLTRIYNSEKLVNVKQGNENVNGEIFQSESGGGSEIDVLISNSSNGGTEEKIDSHKIGAVEEAFDFAKEGSRVFNSGLMANVCGTKSFDECNKITSCDPKARRSLIGIRRRKSGKYAAVITDPIKHKEVCLGTFNTIEEASQAYLSKKSEFEKLRQGNKENKQKKNCDQIQQPESPSVVTSLDTTAGESGSAKRIGSQKTTTRLIGAHKSNTTGRYKSEIINPITKKRIYLGTFGTAEEASHAYQSKKLEFQKLVKAKQQQCTNKRRKSEKLVNVKQELENVNCEPLLPEEASGSPDIDVSFSNSFNEGTFHSIDSDKKGTAEEAFRFAKEGSRVFNSGLMANVCGTKSSDECNKTISCDPKARRSLIGIRRQKSGRYAAVITDPIKHKEVYLGTFASIEEASQAYFSKKSQFEKLRQGNKENKQKKNRDQIQQPESPSVVTSLDTTAGESGSAKRIGPHKTTTRLIGAYKSKTRGRYGSEIINPITKKKIWLGTFGSAEEASHAYQSKKLEFQKLVEAKQQQCTNKQGLENVNCESLLPESATGYVSFSNSFNEGTVQSIDSDKRGTGEEAFHAYQPKKFDLQSSKEVELQSKMPTDSSAGRRQENQEEDEDLWMGEWVQLLGDDREVMFSLKLGLPIIDNYGSLLGEFSSLDDLSIS